MVINTTLQYPLHGKCIIPNLFMSAWVKTYQTQNICRSTPGSLLRLASRWSTSVIKDKQLVSEGSNKKIPTYGTGCCQNFTLLVSYTTQEKSIKLRYDIRLPCYDRDCVWPHTQPAPPKRLNNLWRTQPTFQPSML